MMLGPVWPLPARQMEKLMPFSGNTSLATRSQAEELEAWWQRVVNAPKLPFYHLQRFVPPLRWFFWPNRFLPLLILAGARGGAAVLWLFQNHRRSRFFHLPLAAGLLAEAVLRGVLIWPTPSFRVEDIPVLRELKPPEAALIHLPLSDPLIHQQQLHLTDYYFLFLQTRHGHPILNGPPLPFLLQPEFRALLERNRFLQRLMAFSAGTSADWSSCPPSTLSADLEELRRLGYRYLVLHGDHLSAQALETLEGFLEERLGRPLYEQGEPPLRLFSLTGAAESAGSLTHQLPSE